MCVRTCGVCAHVWALISVPSHGGDSHTEAPKGIKAENKGGVSKGAEAKRGQRHKKKTGKSNVSRISRKSAKHMEKERTHAASSRQSR